MKQKALLGVCFIKPVQVSIIVSSGFTETVLIIYFIYMYIMEKQEFNPRNRVGKSIEIHKTRYFTETELFFLTVPDTFALPGLGKGNAVQAGSSSLVQLY